MAWVGCARLARNMQGGDEAHVSEFSLLVSFLLMQGDDSALAVIRGVYIVWSFSPLSFYPDCSLVLIHYKHRPRFKTWRRME